LFLEPDIPCNKAAELENLELLSFSIVILVLS